MVKRHNSFKEAVAVLLVMSAAVAIGLTILPIVLIFEGAAQDGSLSSRLISWMTVPSYVATGCLAMILVWPRAYPEMVAESFWRLPEQDRLVPVPVPTPPTQARP